MRAVDRSSMVALALAGALVCAAAATDTIPVSAEIAGCARDPMGKAGPTSAEDIECALSHGHAAEPTDTVAAPAEDSGCVRYHASKARRASIFDTLQAIRQVGRSRRAKCLERVGAPKTACLDSLVPLRKRFQELAATLPPFLDTLDRLRDACKEDSVLDAREIRRYEAIAAETCAPSSHPDPYDCEDALFRLTRLYTDQDAATYRRLRERYEEQYRQWRANPHLD